MKYWERLFDARTLKRGREYFKENRVHSLRKQSSSLYTAKVRGTHTYDVVIQKTSVDLMFMQCSCPYSDSWNGNCKHLAAVLCAIDAADGSGVNWSEEPEEKLIYPFADAHGKTEDCYFNMSTIAGSLGINEDEYRRARALVENRQYDEPAQIDFGYASSRYRDLGCIGEIHVAFREDYRRTCTCRVSANAVLDKRCGCLLSGFDPFGDLDAAPVMCRHQAAALLLLEDYISQYDPGDSTDAVGAGLIAAYEKRPARPQGNDVQAGKTVHLEPKLHREWNKLSLTFRIGESRLYILQKLTELVDAADSGGALSLGKSTVLDFGRSDFDEQSVKWYSLIRRYVSDERRRTERSGWSSSISDIKQSVPLYGALLDEFFDIAQGQTIAYKIDEYSSRKENPAFRIEASEPDVKLTVRRDLSKDGAFQGVTVTSRIPEMIGGASYHYVLTENSLSRVSRDTMQRLKPLTSLGTGEHSFHIGRKNLSEFYYTVLPKLRECATISEPDADYIAQNLSPEPCFAFYLDAQDGVPRCRAEACYGGQRFSLSDWDSDSRIDRVLRSTRSELHVLEAVRKFFALTDPTAEEFVCAEDESSIYEMLNSGTDELMSLGEVHSTARFDALRIRRRVRISVGVSLESELLSLELTSDIPVQELMELLDSFRRKKTYHRLRSGQFVGVDESIAELSMMMDAMRLTPKQLIEGKTHIPAYRALYLDRMLEQCGDLDSIRNQQFRRVVRDFRTVNDSDFEVPDSLSEVLRGYQIYGYQWLRTLAAYGFGGILADDMGLGKTLQVITVLLAEKQAGAPGPSLVVSPASLVYNWQEEFTRYAPELSVCPVVGTQAERASLIQKAEEYDVLITSYDLLKRDVSCYEDRAFLYEIIDEAQYIKNHTTAAAKAVKILKSKHRLALTGTPIENRLSELWSIFDYLMPGFLYGYDTFRKELEAPIVRKNDKDAAGRLKRLVSPFILRRLKEEVLKELPEKLEETRYSRMEGQQRLVYDAQVARMRSMLAQEDEQSFTKDKLRILAELTRIRQICCDPSLLLEEYNGGSAKRAACLELIQSAIEGEHRVLLFSQFTSMLAMLEQDLRGKGIEYYTITGDTPKQKRVALVRRFNEGNTPVFLISLKAGGTGLNLTGADVVIHYDPWWNVAAQNQATDRAHRIGQTKVVTVYKLIAKDTIEERIQELQTSKKELADAILSGESVRIADMTKEELLSLLS